MRIYEIDDQDRSYATMSGIDLDIDNQYEAARAIVSLLSKNSDPILKKILSDGLKEIENNIQQVIDTEFAKDAGTAELKYKARQMIINIQKYL